MEVEMPLHQSIQYTELFVTYSPFGTEEESYANKSKIHLKEYLINITYGDNDTSIGYSY
jgi:hypothetical protein